MRICCKGGIGRIDMRIDLQMALAVHCKRRHVHLSLSSLVFVVEGARKELKGKEKDAPRTFACGRGG